jgi:hypothetical protein
MTSSVAADDALASASGGPHPSRRDGPRAVLLESVPLLAMLPLWIWWATWKGGYPPSVFLPALGYLALVAISLTIAIPRGRLSGPTLVACAAGAAFAAWTLASLLWADDKGATEVAAARQVLLLGSLAIPIVWPVSSRALTACLALVPLLALCGAASALGAALADPAGLVDGRLTDPTGYANASAALFAAAVLPAAIAASRRELHLAVRAGALATAGVSFGACLLTQSRGALLALAVTLGLAFILMSDRRRLLVALAILAIGVLPAVSPMLDVHRIAVEGGDLEAAVRHAVRVLVLDGLGLLLLGSIYAAVDRRVEVTDRASRRMSIALMAVAITIAAGGVGVLVGSGAGVGGWVSTQLEDAKTPDYSRLESEPSRFTSGLGSNRYDYWRAALSIFGEEPISGVGAENFLGPYLERRHASTAPVYAHNLWLGTLAELGLVGFIALVALLVALGAGLVRAARIPGARRWVVVAASTPFLYVLVHGSFDWITFFPVLIAPAFALAGAAAAARLPAQLETEASSPRWPAFLTICVLVVFGALVVPILLAARLSDRGFASWTMDPTGATSDLERAADLDPLSATPYVRLGVIAVECRRYRQAAEAFEGALGRDRSQWYPRFQLGLIAAASGHRGSALIDLRRAAALNPREPALVEARRRIRAGKAVSPRAAQHAVLTE